MSFIFKITTTTSPQTFVIPCGNDGTFNATVDYGDGTGSQTVTAYNDSNLTHSFATAGQHTITIDGTFPNVRFYDNAASRVLVDEVVDLGDVGWVNFYRAFRSCTNLTAFNVGTADTSSVIGIQDMFTSCTGLTSLDLSNFDTSNVINMSQMFRACTSLTSLNVSSFDTSSVINMQQIFHTCSGLTSLDVSNFDTSSVSNMLAAFQNCSSLTSLDLSGFNTSSVTTMSYMFYNCLSLTSLNLSGFNTSSVNDMSYMFFDCNSLTTLDLSSFNTSSVTTMHSMFRNCSSLTSLNISNFDTSSVTIMESMFNSCSSLTALNLSNFDTSNVTRMTFMIFNCSSLINLDIKHFDISSVTSGSNFLNFSNNALTTTAYDELLEAWAAQDVQPNVPWHFGDAQYTVETIADWYSPRSASSLSIINNKLVSIADSTLIFGAAQQIDNLIVGNAYKIAGTATCSNSSAQVYIRASTDLTLAGTTTSQDFNTNATGSVTANDTFIATATTLYVGTIVNSHAANDTVTVDAGITVKEVTNYTEANAASEIEYSQENVFGSEEVVNGDFSSNSDWDDTSQGTGTTLIANNVATLTGGGFTNRANLKQSVPTTIGKTYELSVSLLQAENAFILYQTDSTNVLGGFNSAQDVSATFAATQSLTEIQIRSQGGTSIFDNVSVKEITNAVEYKNIPQSARELYTLKDDTWTGSNELVVNGDFANDLSGWSVTNPTGVTVEWTSNGMRILTDGTGGGASQIILEIGKTYLIEFDYTAVSGSLKLDAIINTLDTTKKYSIVKTATQIPLTFYRRSGTAEGIIDNVSVKEIIEVADFVEPVTQGMTLTAAWAVRGDSYPQLSTETSGSVRVDATISNTDSGILMESGGSTAGLILYVYAGVLYFQCGRANEFGTTAERSETSYILPVGEFDYIIEWSADLTNAVLYVNGLRVGSQAYSYTLISGSDPGTVGEVENGVAVNRGGWTANAAGVYSNTITKCDVFVNQVTSDV